MMYMSWGLYSSVSEKQGKDAFYVSYKFDSKSKYKKWLTRFAGISEAGIVNSISSFTKADQISKLVSLACLSQVAVTKVSLRHQYLINSKYKYNNAV